MLLLGLLLLLIVAAATLAAFLRGGEPVSLDLEWVTVRMDLSSVFAVGAITMLTLFVALWLISRGLKKSRQRRQEVKGLRKRAEANESAAACEREAQTQTSSSGASTRTPPKTSGGSEDSDDHFDSAPRDR